MSHLMSTQNAQKIPFWHECNKAPSDNNIKVLVMQLSSARLLAQFSCGKLEYLHTESYIWLGKNVEWNVNYKNTKAKLTFPPKNLNNTKYPTLLNNWRLIFLCICVVNMYFTLRILNGHKVYLIQRYWHIKVSTPSFVCAAELEMEHSALSLGNFNLLQATPALFSLKSKIILAWPPVQHKSQIPAGKKERKKSFKGLIVGEDQDKSWSKIYYLFIFMAR